MLRYSFGEENAALSIENAVKDAVISGSRTGDIAFGEKSLSTREMCEAILEKIKNLQLRLNSKVISQIQSKKENYEYLNKFLKSPSLIVKNY